MDRVVTITLSVLSCRDRITLQYYQNNVVILWLLSYVSTYNKAGHLRSATGNTNSRIYFGTDAGVFRPAESIAGYMDSI